MIYKYTVLFLTALSLAACASTNRSPDIGLCDNAKTPQACKIAYTSQFNRFVDSTFREKEENLFKFNGYVLSFDKSKFADYAEEKPKSGQATNFSIKGSNGAVIDFAAAQNAPNTRFKERINKTFTTQKKNMFLTDVRSSKVAKVDYNITTTCLNEDLTRKQTYIDCSFKGLDQLESALKVELNNKAQLGKPYSHIILLSTGWHNRQDDSMRHFNEFFPNLTASGQAQNSTTFNPLYIGVTWPSDWNIKFISYNNKKADADELGLVWSNYLINKTIPTAIEGAKQTKTPKFVAVGHSFGARVVATGVNSKKYITSYKPGKPLDVLLLKQPAFSRSRLAKNEGFKHSSNFNFYADLIPNTDQVIMTASRRDNFFGNGIAIWSGGGTGHAGTSSSYDESCRLVKKYPATWGARYACYQQIEVNDGDWAKLLKDNKPILFLRMDSKVKGQLYDESQDIVTGHNGVKRRELTDVVYDLIK